MAASTNVTPQRTPRVDNHTVPEHPFNLRRAIEHFERGYLHNVLVLADWDVANAARMLGIHSKTLKAKMEKYEIVGR